jgi:O-antigen/teichoic acid export membrane protein
MAVFQMTAVKLRPVILGIFSMNGVGIIADFRVMETITIFIISVGGMFISIFLPKTSRLLSTNEREKIAQFAYNATKYTSVICVILCMPFLLNGGDILTIYVGKEYLPLVPWLNLWIVTILFFLHNSPIASLVLSTGRTKMLVFCSAASCVISLIINAVLCHRLGAGSAVVGYFVYISIQMSFYYFYFNNRVLGLNSWRVFQSFIIPALTGFLAAFFVMFLRMDFPNPYGRIIGKTGMWFILFAFLLSVFKVIDLKYLFSNFLFKSKYIN